MSSFVKDECHAQEVSTLYLRDVPDDLHRRIKVAAALSGETMQKLAIRALEREVERVEADDAKRKGKR